VLRDWRLGKVGRGEVCDAHPELVRAARNLGEGDHAGLPDLRVRSSCGWCPTSTATPSRRPTARCITNQNELDRLGENCDEFACYVVEVCTECNWNHLTRSYLLGRRHAG